MIETAVFDTKPYDREYLAHAAAPSASRGASTNSASAPRRPPPRKVRVPAYSPHAVAEHAVGLLLTLNRKIHRAYNRVRELNFSLSGLVGFDLHGKTVGIVGTGRIGRITAQIFRGFEAEERWLREKFPDYADDARRVRRLIPGVY